MKLFDQLFLNYDALTLDTAESPNQERGNGSLAVGLNGDF